ncbi:hypothetical protein D9M68_714710 [compost metagenome]
MRAAQHLGRRLRGIIEGRESFKRFTDGLVARGDLLLEKVITLNLLSQGVQMFQAPVAMQATRNRLLIRLDPSIAKSRQLVWVALTFNNRPEDLHAGHASDIADDVGELDIHLTQGFLNTVKGLGLIANLIAALTHQGTHRADGVRRAKSAAQQTVRHELPNPLAIEDIGFTPRGLPGRTRVDQINVESPRIQHFEKGDPVDASRLHGHHVDAH